MPNSRDDRYEEKPRSCLRCRQMFLSKHCGNRICPICASRPVMHTGIRCVSLDFDRVSVEKNVDDESYFPGAE